MNNKTKILLWLAVIVFLTPILFFPFSPDTSIYLDSGRIIANGGKIYVDSIDLKQPLIYYIFAFIYLVFGYSEFAIRFFDFFWQIFTIISLFYLIKKTCEIKTAYITALIYSIAYTALNYSQTMQCESFAALPLVWLIYWRVQRDDNFFNILVCGLLIGVITGFKFTFGIIVFAVIIDILMSNKTHGIFKNILILTIASSFGLFVSMLPLLDSEIRMGYLNVLKYLSYYSSIASFNVDSMKIMIKSIGIFYGDNFSLLLTISFFAGIYLMLKNNASVILSTSKNDNSSNNDSKKYGLLNISFLIFLMLFISIIWEGRYWSYHFSRLYIPMFIISGIGLVKILSGIKIFYGVGTLFNKSIIIIILIGAVLFSPFTRWANTVRTGYYYFSDTNKYDMSFSEFVSDKMVPQRKHYKEIAKTVNDNIDNNDFVMLTSTGSNTLNYFLKTDNITRFRNFQFVYNNLNISDWQKAYLDELTKADWIIIQTDDSREEIIGQNLSSFDLFKMDANNYKYLNQNFILFDTVGNFLIYRRKSDDSKN